MYTEPNLDRSERVLGVFYGGRNQWGGKLIVTDQRLIFSGLDLGVMPDVLAYVGSQAGLPADLGKTLFDHVRDSVGKDVWLVHIIGVDAVGSASLLSPPKIRITTATLETFEVGIVNSMRTPNISPDNNQVRDNAVLLLRRAVANATKA